MLQPELSKSYMDMASKLFTLFTFTTYMLYMCNAAQLELPAQDGSASAASTSEAHVWTVSKPQGLARQWHACSPCSSHRCVLWICCVQM